MHGDLPCQLCKRVSFTLQRTYTCTLQRIYIEVRGQPMNDQCCKLVFGHGSD